MTGRLDRVLVATRRRTVEIPWESRDALLVEIRHLESGKPVVKAFEDVGASRPVTIDSDGEGLLVQAIELMSRNAGGVDRLPEGLWDLRNALIDELHDEGLGP